MTAEDQLPLPVTTPAGRGAAWLTEGFDYFKKAWLTWIGITVLLFILTIILSFIPIINIFSQIIAPVFAAGLMLGCREQDQGREISVAHIIAGFSKNTGQLILAGVLYFAGCFIILILVGVLAFLLTGGTELMSQLQSNDINAVINGASSLTLVMLIGLAVYVPLIAAFWFAPALIVLDNLDAVTAMKLSFTGCIKNVVPLLLYGLIGLVFSIIASMLLFIGWLVLVPMLIASVYISYKDIFSRPAE